MGACYSTQSRRALKRKRTNDTNLKSFEEQIEQKNSLLDSIDYEVHIIDYLIKEGKQREMYLNDISSSQISERAINIERIPSDVRQRSEDIMLFWYDENETPSPPLESIKVAATECHNYIQFFIDRIECIDRIRANKEEKIVLITLNASEVSIISDIHNLVNVQSIIVLMNHNEQSNEGSLSTELYSKVVKIQKDPDILKKVIRAQLHAIRQQISRFHFYDHRQKTTRDLTTEAASYLWFQLMFDVLKEMTISDQAKNDMLRKCREYYSSSIVVLNSIRKFEVTYKPTDAVLWYAKQSFVYRIVNRALRTEDVEQLYTFRFFIVDLSRQLAMLHREQKGAMRHIVTVFRGLHLTFKECKNLENSRGKFISTNGFLSTSRDETVARLYANVSTSGTHEKQSVMFKIMIETSQHSIIFADIADLSPFPDDKEVLFDIGTTFAIDKVTYVEASRNWEVVLIATERGSILKSDYIKMSSHELLEENIVFLFGKLLIDMGEFSKAYKYFVTLLLDDQYKKLNLLPSIYYYIGLSLFHAGYLPRAFSYYLCAFREQNNLINGSRVEANNMFIVKFARTLNGIGMLYSTERRFKEGLGCYIKALSLLESRLDVNHPLIAACFTNIGIILRQVGYFDLSLIYHEKSLSTREQLYRFEHPDHVRTSINIALVLDDKGEHEKAIHLLQECRSSVERILPIDHPLTALIHLNIGTVYLNMKNIPSARLEFYRALAIFECVLPPLHLDTATTLANIGTVCEKQQELDTALRYHQRALHIRQLTSPRNHIHLAESYLTLGNIYHLDGQWELARQFCSDALAIYNQLEKTENILSNINACLDISKIAERQMPFEFIQ
jgi:tetratricopeptide (TPR) repeat protein